MILVKKHKALRCRLLILGLIFVCLANAQVKKGTPKSWTENIQSKRSMSPVVLKGFDLRKIQEEDVVNDLDKSIPWRFGHEIDVDYGLTNSGTWNELPNGKGRIWRVNIVSKGAKTLNFIFDSYDLPKGASIFLYNADKSDLLGAYTDVFNNPEGVLGTWTVEGESVWVEYYEPSNQRGRGKLNIDKVVHGYRSITDAEIEKRLIGFGDSGPCNYDVECPTGEDFDPLKDRLKHSVARVLVGGGICTGTLINNTANDASLYFLTANHCKGADETLWAFRFNWISRKTSCGTEESSENIDENQTTSRAILLASNVESDFKLLKLDGGVEESWDLEWAGWDRREVDPSYTVGIHHPVGDIMKVCRSNSPIGTYRGLIGSLIPDPIDCWVVQRWDFGVTEGGSSGSALFDSEGRIIGQLAGGGADCAGVVNNGASDFYGRFDTSWDFGNTNDSRLSNWLDPLNTGAEILDMLSVEKPGETPLPPKDEVIVFFKSSNSTLNIVNDSNKTLRYTVYNMLGKELNAGQLLKETQEIEVGNVSSGMYFVHIKNVNSNASFTKKVMVNNRL